MTPRKQREALLVKILETERMMGEVSDHPIMNFSFNQRLSDLKNKLAEIPASSKEANVTLLFSGGPVFGSQGIDAGFLGKVLLPFQKMVHSDLAHRGYGKVAAKGPVKNADDARLFLTALPRGSFGVELSKLDNNNLFNEDEVSDSLVHISKLIGSSAKSDEEFIANLDEISFRTISGLRQFLKVVSDDKAGVTIESGNIRAVLSNEEVQNAYARVSETTTKHLDVELYGILKGILLESWKFDFISDQGEVITGRLDENISEQEVADTFVQFFNKPCKAMFEKTSVFLKNGRIKDSYTLKSVS